MKKQTLILLSLSLLLGCIFTGCGGSDSASNQSSNTTTGSSQNTSSGESQTVISEESIIAAEEDAGLAWQTKATNYVYYKIMLPEMAVNRGGEATTGTWYFDEDRLYYFFVDGYVLKRDEVFEYTLEEVPDFLWGEQEEWKTASYAVMHDATAFGYNKAYQEAERTTVTINDREFLRLQSAPFTAANKQWDLERELVYIGYFTMIDNEIKEVENVPANFGVIVDIKNGGDLDLAMQYVDSMPETLKLMEGA